MMSFAQFRSNKEFIDAIKEEHNEFLGESPYVVDFKSSNDVSQIEFRFQRIWKRIKNAKWNVVGNLKNEKVLKHKEGLNLYYALVDKNNNPLFVLALDKELPFSVASYEYHVSDIVKKGSNVYQNDLYKFLVSKEDLVLYSDINQTKNASNAWNRLINDSSVDVKAINLSGEDLIGSHVNSKSYLKLSNK